MVEGSKTPAEVGIRSFVYALADYKYCPPSDNLWTIEIRQHSYGGGDSANNTLVHLYNAIRTVNDSWRGSTFLTTWEVNMPSDLKQDVDILYLSNFTDELGVFLAQDVTVQTFENQFDQSTGMDLVGHGGFLNMGRVFQGRALPNTCNISFLISNWSISDILIEPWIAAIAQRGLIEREDGLNGTGSIRADIRIRQYSASSPTSEEGKMILRKAITLYNAFPQKRGAIELKYDSGSAGQYQKDVVTFQFDEYSIEYYNTILKKDTRLVMANIPTMNPHDINNFA